MSKLLTLGKEEKGRAIAAETEKKVRRKTKNKNNNRTEKAKRINIRLSLLEKAAPTTTTSGKSRVIPILEIMGSRIIAATVCEIKVATTPQNTKIQKSAIHGCDNGNATNQVKKGEEE